MKSPFFTLIVPTLNEERYLPRLLKCIAGQTNHDFELIIVDGQSDDNTKKEYEKWKSFLPKSSFLTSDKRNVGWQRNLGAKKAKGEYLVFLDADCMIDPHFLSLLKEKIDKEKFLLATTWIIPDRKKALDELLLKIGNIGFSFAASLNVPLAGGYSTVIEKNAFNSIGGYRSEILYNEDYDLSLNAKKKNIRMEVLKDPKVVYSTRRFHTEGLLKLLPKMIGGQLYMFLVGPITKDIFHYRMGGHIHTRKDEEKPTWILTTYKKAASKLEKQVLRFFQE